MIFKYLKKIIKRKDRDNCSDAVLIISEKNKVYGVNPLCKDSTDNLLKYIDDFKLKIIKIEYKTQDEYPFKNELTVFLEPSIETISIDISQNEKFTKGELVKVTGTNNYDGLYTID